MQQRLVLGRDAGGRGDSGDRLDALALGRQEQAGAVVAQGLGPIGMAQNAREGLNKGGEPVLALVSTP